MNWFTVISNLASRIPIEKVLFPPRDNIKALEEFAATMPAPVAQKEAPSEQKAATITQEPVKAPEKQTVATACVPCALGHFSTSAGLLNEAVRFKDEGITSNDILDRMAKVLEEQNALERVDLTQENIQVLPSWEKELAEDALSQSRKLRHSLESFTSIEQLNQAAADTSSFYRELNRKWFKQRFAHLGQEKAKRIAEEVEKLSPEDKERALNRAEELEGSNPTRVRFDRGDIDSAIGAAKRLKSDRDLYIFATYLGYTIDKRPPPGMESYVIVHPDGTTETIKQGR